MATEKYSYDTGVAPQGVPINDNRRIFNFGDRVAELAPQQSPFFVYLSKVAKKATDDPVFKFLEQRHQWQRRNFEVRVENIYTATGSAAIRDFNPVDGDELDLTCHYDVYGRSTGTTDTAPEFLLTGQIIVVDAEFAANGSTYSDVKAWIKLSATDAAAAGGVGVEGSIIKLMQSDGTLLADGDLTDSVSTLKFADGKVGQVIGSAFAEASGAPDGWKDELYDREGYTQIFKTGMNIFSGTALSTHYRGVGNEWKRVWTDKLMEHKMDLEHAMLFGIGRSDESNATGPERYSWGAIPYTEQYGKVYNFSYASSGYDAFLDAMEDFFAPESGNSGNKLVLASRKVITYLNKIGNGSFLNNTVGGSQYRLDVQSIKGAFGHQVTVVNTIYGNLHFVAEPLLRGPFEDYCVAVDMKNVAYRPLVGNGNNRDTYIVTNIQANDMDGRQDMILTEAGLEIQLPETHAVFKWS